MPRLVEKKIPLRYFNELVDGNTVARYETTGEVMGFQVGRMYSIRNKSDDRKLLALCTQSKPHHLINVHHANNVHYISNGL